MRRGNDKKPLQGYRTSYRALPVRSKPTLRREARPPKLLLGLIAVSAGVLLISVTLLLLRPLLISKQVNPVTTSLTAIAMPSAQSAASTPVSTPAAADASAATRQGGATVWPTETAVRAATATHSSRVPPVPTRSTKVLFRVDQPTVHDFAPPDGSKKAAALLEQLGVPPDETSIGQGQGGISPANSLPLLSEINDITGAVYDAAHGRLLILGSYNPDWPKLDPSDLLVALRAIYSNNADIGVSIDPIDANQFGGPMQVSYFGVPRDTHFAMVMYEADRYLKTLSSGQDNLTKLPIAPGVPGYRSELDLMLEQNSTNETPQWHRMWYLLRDSSLKIRTTPESDAMAFGEVPIMVQARFVVFDAQGKKRDVPGSSPVVDAFVQHFNSHFADFAARKPEVRQLVQLSKLISIAQWLRSHEIVADTDWLDAYPLGKISTPSQTPGQVVTKTRTEQHANGSVTYKATLFGGVDLNFANREVVATPDDSVYRMRELAKQLPLRKTVGISPALDGPGTLKVVAIALRPSDLAGNLALNLHIFDGKANTRLPLDVILRYSSFDTELSPLGKGWSVDPLRASPSAQATYTLNDKQVNLYEAVTVTGPLPGKRRRYVNSMQIINGRVVYTLQEGEGAARLYFDLTERIYVVTDDGIENTFDTNGWLKRQRRDTEWISIMRDATGNPTTFSHSDGRIIRLRYADNRLIEITGADGARVQMQYEDGGLVGFTRPEGMVHIAYAGGYPSRMWDSQGRSEFAFDNLGRLTRKRNARLERVFEFAADGSSTN